VELELLHHFQAVRSNMAQVAQVVQVVIAERRPRVVQSVLVLEWVAMVAVDLSKEITHPSAQSVVLVQMELSLSNMQMRLQSH
jgi:hypothetical protein